LAGCQQGRGTGKLPTRDGPSSDRPTASGASGGRACGRTGPPSDQTAGRRFPGCIVSGGGSVVAINRATRPTVARPPNRAGAARSMLAATVRSWSRPILLCSFLRPFTRVRMNLGGTPQSIPTGRRAPSRASSRHEIPGPAPGAAPLHGGPRLPVFLPEPGPDVVPLILAAGRAVCRERFEGFRERPADVAKGAPDFGGVVPSAGAHP